LRRGAGTQFHPDVVKAFLRVTLSDQMEREKLSLEQAA
jgi:HD-GYP domain-containing protein (c-di-GMP phosphodiesterase class II)